MKLIFGESSIQLITWRINFVLLLTFIIGTTLRPVDCHDHQYAHCTRMNGCTNVTVRHSHTLNSKSINKKQHYNIKTASGMLRLKWSSFWVNGKMPSCTGNNYLNVIIG